MLKMPPESNRLTLVNCGFEQCAPGHDFGPFVRDHLLVHFVVAGKGIYRRKGWDYNVSAGQAFIILPNETTLYRSDDEEPWSYYWVGAAGAAIDETIAFLGLGAPETLVLSPRDADTFPSLMQSCIDCFLRRVDNPLRTRGSLDLFLAAVYDETRGLNAAAGAADVVEKALAYIHGSFSYDISFAWLIHQLGISRAHFYRMFKARTGHSPQQYLVRYRIEKAQKLLYRSTLNITEIAYSCGFSDPSHFARIFKAYVKLSPRAFQRNGRYTPLIPPGASVKPNADNACFV